ncbi:hypothetical protein C5167_010043 [Papaver somniferum]|uniref:Uncharacterized protein n=1 Tax=Papaver somniferum TaxID=3469 RepID=A0A4Y7K0H8_PAPSO|nr:hypothetical protein C5167_010043 [Papaver somniferum]
MEWEDPVKFWITEEHQVLSGSNIKRSHRNAKHTMVFLQLDAVPVIKAEIKAARELILEKKKDGLTCR